MLNLKNKHLSYVNCTGSACLYPCTLTLASPDPNSMEFKVASSNSITEMRGSWYGSRHSNLLAQRVLKRMGLMNLWIIASHPTININNDKANTIIIAFSSIIETDYIGAAVDLRKSGIPFLLCFVCGSYKGLHGVFDENENIGCVAVYDICGHCGACWR
eukprot:1004754_1